MSNSSHHHPFPRRFQKEVHRSNNQGEGLPLPGLEAVLFVLIMTQAYAQGRWGAAVGQESKQARCCSLQMPAHTHRHLQVPTGTSHQLPAFSPVETMTIARQMPRTASAVWMPGSEQGLFLYKRQGALCIRGLSVRPTTPLQDLLGPRHVKEKQPAEEVNDAVGTSLSKG